MLLCSTCPLLSSSHGSGSREPASVRELMVLALCLLTEVCCSGLSLQSGGRAGLPAQGRLALHITWHRARVQGGVKNWGQMLQSTT